MNFNSKCTMNKVTSNEETSMVTSSDSRQEISSSLNDKNENANDAIKIPIYETYRQRTINKFYTEKFESMLKKNDIHENCQSFNSNNVEKQMSKNTSFDTNFMGNGQLDVLGQKLSKIGAKDDQQSKLNINCDTLKHYNHAIESSSAFTSQDKNIGMAHKLTDSAINRKYLKQPGNFSIGCEYQQDSDEEWEIFKSGSFNETDAVENSTIEDDYFLYTGENLFLKILKSCPTETIDDIQLLVKKLKDECYLSAEILSVLSGECLLTGVNENEILTYLRQKEFLCTDDKLKKDISQFFKIAVQVGIIKNINRRYFLYLVDDMIIQNASQYLKQKTDIENNVFENSNCTEDFESTSNNAKEIAKEKCGKLNKANHLKNDLRKTTVLNMINIAKSRREDMNK